MQQEDEVYEGLRCRHAVWVVADAGAFGRLAGFRLELFWNTAGV